MLFLARLSQRSTVRHAHSFAIRAYQISTTMSTNEPESKADAEFVPTSAKGSLDVAQCFYSWREMYPELELLLDNIEIIKEESRSIGQWVPWPEDHFNLGDEVDNGREWTVFPLMHTFPAYDPAKTKWVSSTCAHCPKTVELLKKLPTIRTALFSKLGPGTQLSSHTGWADLANYVLRTHLCLDIPSDGTCGLLVDGEIQYHRPNHILVFDDSKPHRAFNNSPQHTRTVLIVDLWRPLDVPRGTATGSHTEELDGFVSQFK